MSKPKTPEVIKPKDEPVEPIDVKEVEVDPGDETTEAEAEAEVLSDKEVLDALDDIQPKTVDASKYPVGMPGEFFAKYDKLSAVGQTLIGLVFSHIKALDGSRVYSDEDGAALQVSIYHTLVGILNLDRPEFDEAFALLMATLMTFRKGAFEEHNRLRWMQFVKLTKAERDLFSVLMTAFPELADGRSRKQVFRQFEKRIEVALVEASKTTRLTPQGAANVLAFYRR